MRGSSYRPRAKASPRARPSGPSCCDPVTRVSDRPSADGALRDGIRQDQFLTVLPRDEAVHRFETALARAAPPRRAERVSLAEALGRVLAEDQAAPLDLPPFDRSGVDGFA